MGGWAEARPQGQQTGGLAALALGWRVLLSAWHGKPSCGSSIWEARASRVYRLRKQRSIN